MTALTYKGLRAYALYFLAYSTLFKAVAVLLSQFGLPLGGLEGMAMCAAAFVMLFRFFKGQGRNTLPQERNYLALSMAVGFSVVDMVCLGLFDSLGKEVFPADATGALLAVMYLVYFVLNTMVSAVLMRATLSTFVSQGQADRYFASKKK